MNHNIYEIDGQMVVRSDEGLVMRAKGTTREQIDLEDEIEILGNAISQNKRKAKSLESSIDPKTRTKFNIIMILGIFLINICLGIPLHFDGLENFDLMNTIYSLLLEISLPTSVESLFVLWLGRIISSKGKEDRLKRAEILSETEELEELLKMKQKRLRFLKEKTHSCDKDLKGVSLRAKQREFTSSIESRTSRLAELERAKRALYDLGLVQEETIGQAEPGETTKTILLDPKKDII